MNKKILLPLLIIPLLASCGQKPHEHTFSDTWSHDEASHWKDATCEHTDLSKDRGAHIDTDNNNVCDICGCVLKEEHAHTFSEEWSNDATNHWHAATCGHDVTSDLSAHTFDENGTCTVCGYKKANIHTAPFTYNGYIGDTTIVEGDEQTLADLYELIFTSGGETQFTYNITDGLAKYNDNTDIPPFTPDKKLNFSTVKVTAPRTLEDGSSIETFLVNPVEEFSLCEYAAVAGKTNTYRLYDVEGGICYDHVLLQRYFFGSPDCVLVTSDEVTFDPDTKMATINMIINGTVAYDVEGQLITKDVVAKYSVSFGDGPENDVRIIEQPKDITISYPDPVDLSFKVSNESKVLEYTWYCGSYNYGTENSFSPLTGNATHSSSLHLAGIGSAQSVIPFKCLIKTENRIFYTASALVYVDNFEEFVPTVFLLDYPIKAGESLDLAKTPYGTGVITYDANAKDIIFNNVNFNNRNLESNRESVAVSIQARHNTIDEYNFIFEGENNFTNDYWEDVGQGGFAFTLYFLGDDSVKPTVNFKGDPISIVGGTNAIYTNGNLHIYNDISLYGYLGRLTRGIVGTSVTIEKGVNISANIGGDLLWSRQGNVEIKEGVKINAIINCASFAHSQDEMYGIMGSRNVIISNADISITFNVDYNYFVEKQSSLTPLEGIYSAYGGVMITNSNVLIDVHTSNVPEIPDYCLVNGGGGIGGKMVDIRASNIRINYQSLAFMNITGITSTEIRFNNSHIDINIKGYCLVSGIVSQLVIDEPSQPGSIDIVSSNINVQTYAEVYESEGRYYLDAGIRAVTINYDLGINDQINITTNRASAIVMAFNHVDVCPQREEEHVPTHLILDGLTVDANPYDIDIDYYTGFDIDTKKNYFVTCEALYEKSSNNYITNLNLKFVG